MLDYSRFPWGCVKTRTPCQLTRPRQDRRSSEEELGYLTQLKGQVWGIYPFVLNEQRSGKVRLAYAEIGLRIATTALVSNEVMDTIQVAIANERYATALRELLARSAGWKVLSVDVPDPRIEGVIVLDAQALDRLPSQTANPERVVLIARNDPGALARAWEAGIVSVVSENDPMSTAMLAIMAARLQVAKAVRKNVPSGPRQGQEEVRIDRGKERRRESS